MASNSHNFIVSAIARKIRQLGFKITYLDSPHSDISIENLNLPPKIIHHKPDIVGERDQSFCIGEAKTSQDIMSERTKNQLMDFFSIVKQNNESKLILGIPLEAKQVLVRLLADLGLLNEKQIEIMYIPEAILPEDAEI